MTHLHLSTLGQCLISLSRQGISEPLYRVLRFAESGAIVPNFQKTQEKSVNKGDLKKTKMGKRDSNSIQTNQVKVSFKKASDILDQINQIQQQPDPVAVNQQPSPKGVVYPPNYSTEEQLQDIKRVTDQISPLERYLSDQLTQMKEHLELLKSNQVNNDYLRQVQEEVDFLSLSQTFCQQGYSQLAESDTISEFTRFQLYIYEHVPELNDPQDILKLMQQFNLTYFDANRCFQLNNCDLALSINCLQRLFFTIPKTFFKIDKIDEMD